MTDPTEPNNGPTDEQTRPFPGPLPDEPPPTQKVERAWTAQRPPATERLRLPPDPRTGMVKGFGVVIVLVVLAATAVAGYLQRSSTAPDNVISRALVGPEGGALQFGTDGRLIIPRGAVSTSTAITIRQVRINRPVRLTRTNGEPITYERDTLTAYAFEPTDLVFATPVTIEFPARDGGSLLVVRGNQLRVVGAEQRPSGVVAVTTQRLDFA